MKRTPFSFLFFFLLLQAPADAASKHEHYKLYWRERDGEILLSTVCDNYGYGSIAYRGCRAQTKHHFEAQCQRYREKEKYAGGEPRLRYRRLRRRYCRAASLFGPVN